MKKNTQPLETFERRMRMRASCDQAAFSIQINIYQGDYRPYPIRKIKCERKSRARSSNLQCEFYNHALEASRIALGLRTVLQLVNCHDLRFTPAWQVCVDKVTPLRVILWIFFGRLKL